jgi:hypothetical protein
LTVWLCGYLTVWLLGSAWLFDSVVAWQCVVA